MMPAAKFDSLAAEKHHLVKSKSSGTDHQSRHHRQDSPNEKVQEKNIIVKGTRNTVRSVMMPAAHRWRDNNLSIFGSDDLAAYLLPHVVDKPKSTEVVGPKCSRRPHPVALAIASETTDEIWENLETDRSGHAT